MRLKVLLLCAAVLLVAAPCFGQATLHDVVKVAAGANGIWFDGPDALPSDFELGGNGRASLSPHISLVGGAYYGFSHSYLRGSGGIRLTATDVNDPNFSVGIGMQYQVSSETDLRPQEWAPDVSVGWKPWPEQFPKLIVGAQGSYGLHSNKAYLIAAARWALDLF